MTALSPRVRAILSGAVLGGLIWAGFDELGFWGALKYDMLIGQFAAALIVGAVAGAWHRSRQILFVAAGLVVLTIAIVSFTPLAAALASPMVRADQTPVEKLDAIVVLSGGITADNLMNSQSLDRLLKGIEVARQHGGTPLLLSRETLPARSGVVSDSADQARILALASVTAPVLFIDSASSTRDEALRVRMLTAAKDWKRIGLVTSPLHTRRACRVFERAGFQVTCIPADSREGAIANVDSPGERLQVFQGWFYETAGSIDYRLKGWM